jgi:hypothetical protein
MRPNDGNRSLGKAYRPGLHGESTDDRRFFHPATVEEIKRRAAKYAKDMEEQEEFTWLPKRGDG